MKVHNLLVTGSLTSGGENITEIAGTVTDLSSSLLTAMNDMSTSIKGMMAITGSNLFKGNQTISGSIIPAVNGTYDLGSSTHEFRHLYLSSASLYIDGTKVLGSTTQELQITTDTGQSFKILESGSDTITLQSNDGNITLATSGGGDVILDPTSGIIALKGSTQIYAGNRILSSDGNNIHFGNGVTISGSLLATGTNLLSGSQQISDFGYTTTSSVNAISSSINTRINSITGIQATTGSNNFVGTQTITGSLYISSDLIVQGSSSLQNITASAVNIGANIVNLNTSSPAIRFAGMSIFDSGSIGGSGSFLYDSQQDEFIFIHRGDGVNITSSVFLMGAQTYNNVGNETYPTTNRLLKGTGNEHVGDSIVTETDGGIGISGSLSISGSIVATGTSLWSGSGQLPSGVISGSAQLPSGTVSGSVQVSFTGTTGYSTYINQAVLTTSSPTFAGLTNNGTYSQTTTSTQPVMIYGDSAGSNGLFRIQIDEVNDSFGTGTRTYLGDGGNDIFIGTGNSSYTPSNTYIALNQSGEISMGAGSATKHLILSTSGYLGVNVNPAFYLDVQSNVANTFYTIAQFENRDYTSGTRSFIRVRNWLSAGGSYSSYFGQGQDGKTYIIANNSARGGDIVIDGGTGAVSLSNNLTVAGLYSVPNTSYFISGTQGFRFNNSTDAFNNLIIRDNGEIYARSGLSIGTANTVEPLTVSFAAHGLISQHRQSNGIGVGQNFYMKFNNADGNAVNYAGVYADIQSNTTGAHSGRMILQVANAGNLLSAVIVSNNGATTFSNTINASGSITTTQSLFSTKTIVAGEATPLHLSYTSSDGVGPAVRLGSGGQGFWDIQPSSNNTRLSFEWTDSVNTLSLFSNGRVSINSTEQNTSNNLYVNGALRVNRTIYNWYQNGTNDWDGFAFLHIKTNLHGGGGGNVDHTMSLFYARLYSYSSAYIREGHFGFHNWSGTLYNPVTTGNIWSGGYVSSDNFVVLVIALGSGTYFGINIDWHQSYPYTFRDRSVTAVSRSNSATGVY